MRKKEQSRLTNTDRSRTKLGARLVRKSEVLPATSSPTNRKEAEGESRIHET